jgi:hypothetical protein
MNRIEIKDSRQRVLDILKNFEMTYGFKADLVCVNSQTIGTDSYNEIQDILNEENIATEIDDRVAAGTFMFQNRELAVSNVL